MAVDGNGNGVTVGMLASVTVSPADVPTPAIGAAGMADALQRLMTRKGITTRVDAVYTIILSRPNPNPEETFKETVFRVLDGDGRPMPDRQVRVLEHRQVSHPFELLMADGRTEPERRFGFFATSYDAIAVGEAWQKGLLDVRMSDLPAFAGGAPPVMEPART